jgi:hypothetical protein
VVLAAWSLFLWATRIRNALGDDDLSGAETAWAVGVAVAFTLGALALLLAAVRRPALVPTVRVVAGVTAVYWPVRVVLIAFGGHDAAFVAVHTVLGIVSVALAVWAWTATAARRPSTARTGVAV